jgi:chromosome segregation ATPase
MTRDLLKESEPGWSHDAFTATRHRLDQLEYTEHLDKDSVALVSRLLADLIQTTVTCRQYKSQLDIGLKEQEAIKEQQTPLKNEIARLTAENNHLHRDVVKLEDDIDLQKREWVAQVRKLETKISELQFTNSQLKQNIVQVRDQESKTRLQVEDLLRRVDVVVPEVAGNTIKQKKLFQRVQKIDIETGLGNHKVI